MSSVAFVYLNWRTRRGRDSLRHARGLDIQDSSSVLCISKGLLVQGCCSDELHVPSQKRHCSEVQTCCRKHNLEFWQLSESAHFPEGSQEEPGGKRHKLMQREGLRTSQSWSGNFWLSPGKPYIQDSRQNGGTPGDRHVLSCMAQGKRGQAKEVRHKWKGIQVNFLEERTLRETCVNVPDFQGNRLNGWRCWLPRGASWRPAETLAGSVADRKWEGPGRWLPLGMGPASQRITNVLKALTKMKRV